MSALHDLNKFSPPRMYYAVRSCNLLHAPAIFLDWIDVKAYIEHDLKRSMEYRACETMVEAFDYIYRDNFASAKFSSGPADASLPKTTTPALSNLTMRTASKSPSRLQQPSKVPPETHCLPQPQNSITLVSSHQNVIPVAAEIMVTRSNHDATNPALSVIRQNEISTMEDNPGVNSNQLSKSKSTEGNPINATQCSKLPVDAISKDARNTDARSTDSEETERFKQLVRTSQRKKLAAIIQDRAKTIPFPIKLYEMLDRAETEGFDDVIHWEPNGRGFTIKDPFALENDVLPRFFRLTKYRSFLRQLQLYGFFRTISGPKQGLCHHELFRRGGTDCLLQIRRSKRDFT